MQNIILIGSNQITSLFLFCPYYIQSEYFLSFFLLPLSYSFYNAQFCISIRVCSLLYFSYFSFLHQLFYRNLVSLSCSCFNNKIKKLKIHIKNMNKRTMTIEKKCDLEIILINRKFLVVISNA